MKFFKTKNEFLIFCVVSMCLWCFTKFSLINNLRISLDSIFSGLLALTGFVLTARTFITFKLNEVFYQSPKYRERVEKLQKEGAYQKELYDPLKSMDRKLGRATYMCFTSVSLFALLSFLPESKTIILSSTQSYEKIYELLKNIDTLTLFIKSPSNYVPVLIKGVEIDGYILV